MMRQQAMRPFAIFPRGIARKIRVVFTDIDDTLTLDGRLPASAFSAMWKLFEHGISVVPVTGRPAGWCDHIARMWPVAGVIGENGAFYFTYDAGRRNLEQQFLLTESERARFKVRLAALGKKILRAVPGSALASDQPYRIHDLAIDYSEDVPALPNESVGRIVSLFETAGATTKVSSIHVNGWFGSWDKIGMIQRFAQEKLGLALALPRDHAKAIYVGDSPNDEPAFAFFRYSVGVANVRRFLDHLEHPPSYVTRRAGGDGFAEIARHLLLARTRASRTGSR